MPCFNPKNRAWQRNAWIIGPLIVVLCLASLPETEMDKRIGKCMKKIHSYTECQKQETKK